MDLQDLACSRWKHCGIQGKVHITRLLTERRHRLRRDILTYGEIHFHKDHTYFGSSYEMESTQHGCQDIFLERLLQGRSVCGIAIGIRDT